MKANTFVRNDSEGPYGDAASTTPPSLYRRISTVFVGKRSERNSRQQRVHDAGLIHPRSRGKFIFDVVIFGSIVYLAFLIPLDIAMNIETFDVQEPLFWISRILDCLFIIDLVLTFFTALDPGHSVELILDKNVIAERYLKSWFLIDMISSIPFDVLIWLSSASFGNDNLFAATRLLRFSKIIRVVKILRVMRLQRLNLTQSAAASGFNMFSDVAKNAAAIFYGAHWMTCCFIFLCQETEAEEHDIMQLEGAERYIAGLYYTFTYLTTVGFGDIAADSSAQRIFMIFGLTIGSFTTTYFMSTIINLVATKNQEKTRERMMANRIEEYLLHRKIPDKLQHDIREYVRMVNSNAFGDEQAILNAMSPELRKRCAVYTYGEFVRGIPYLSWLGISHFSYFRFFRSFLLSEMIFCFVFLRTEIVFFVCFHVRSFSQIM